MEGHVNAVGQLCVHDACCLLPKTYPLNKFRYAQQRQSHHTLAKSTVDITIMHGSLASVCIHTSGDAPSLGAAVTVADLSADQKRKLLWAKKNLEAKMQVSCNAQGHAHMRMYAFLCAACVHGHAWT